MQNICLYVNETEIGINVKNIVFAIDTVSGNNSFAYGTSATLQINPSASNYDTTGTYTYQWYTNTTSATTGGTAIKDATNASYKIDNVTKASYYYLVVKDGTSKYTTIPISFKCSMASCP